MQLWWGYRPDPDQYLSVLLTSEGKYAKSYGYADPEMDALFREQQAALDVAERRRVFRRIADRMNEESAIIPWHYGSDFKGLQKTVRGFEHRQDGITLFSKISLDS